MTEISMLIESCLF